MLTQPNDANHSTEIEAQIYSIIGFQYNRHEETCNKIDRRKFR